MGWKCWLKFRCKGVLLFLLGIALSPVYCAEISKREAQIISIIEEAALTLNAKKFLYDPIMVQNTAKSIYTDPKKREGSNAIFRKENPDHGKEAVALSSAENKWAIPTPRGDKKRQFILLKSAPNGVQLGTPGAEITPYFGSFVYVSRLLGEATPEMKVFEVAGIPSIVEWDIWETRPKQFYQGWETCDYSMLFTCESILDMIMTASQTVERGVAKKKPAPTPVEPQSKWPPLIPVKAQPGYETFDYSDLYMDLDFQRFGALKTSASKKTKRKRRKRSTFEMQDEGRVLRRIKRLTKLMGKADELKPDKALKKVGDPTKVVKDKADVVKKPKFEKGANIIKSKVKGDKLKGMAGPLKDAADGVGAGGLTDQLDKANDLEALLGSVGKTDNLESLLGGAGIEDLEPGSIAQGLMNGRSLSGALGGVPGADMLENLGGDDILKNFGGITDSDSLSSLAGLMGSGGGAEVFSTLVKTFEDAPGKDYFSSVTSALGGVGDDNKIVDTLKNAVGGENGGEFLSGLTGGLTDAFGPDFVQGIQKELMGAAGDGVGSDFVGTITENLERASGGDLMESLTGIVGSTAGGSILGGSKGVIESVMAGSLVGAFGKYMQGSAVPGNVADVINPMELFGLPYSVLNDKPDVPGGLLGVFGGLTKKAGLKDGDDSVFGLIGGLADEEGISSKLAPLKNALSGKIDEGFLGALTSGFGGLDGPKAGAVGAGLSKIVGIGLGDADIGSISGAITGIVNGDIGPPCVIGTLLSGGLGKGGGVRALLEGTMFETVNTKVHQLARDLSKDFMYNLHTPGNDGITGHIGGIVEGIMEGVGGKDGPMQMATKVLGPITSYMDPINAVMASSLGIMQGLPVLGMGMGQSILSKLPSITDSMSLGGLLQGMGIGQAVDSVKALSDLIISSGETTLSPVDVLGNGMIDGAAKVFEKMGMPPQFSKLAAIGSKLAWCVELLNYRSAVLAVRLRSDMIGASLNSGNYRAAGAGPAKISGMRSWQQVVNMDGIPSNGLVTYGYTYPGAGENRDFFLPEGSYVRSVFSSGDKKILGYHMPGVDAGNFDVFYPDDEKAAEELVGTAGTLTPSTYKQPHRDANNGIKGRFEKNHKFIPINPARFAVINTENTQMLEQFWLPPDTKTKLSIRPKQTVDGRTLIYGHLFNGIKDSPHIFVAEGNTLSGIFVPDDPDYPDIQSAPHGVFIPDSIAGHARFIVEDIMDFEHVKEVRGAFFPDAMYLSGAIGGRLSQRKTGRGVFNFGLDRLGVEFVYVKGHPSMRNIWASFLSKEEWTYRPPPIPLTVEPLKKKHAVDKIEDEKHYFGIKIRSQKTVAFFPSNFEVEGFLTPVDKKVKRPPIQGALTVGKLYSSWPFKIGKMKADAPTTDEPVPFLFVPTDYPKEDALICNFTFEPGKKDRGFVKFSDKQDQQTYAFSKGDDLWLPPKFISVLASKEKPKYMADDDVVTPGTYKKALVPPTRPANYYFGHEFVNNSKDYHEDTLKKLPHEYHYGYYFIDPSSAGPVFLPEVGALGKFTPNDSSIDPQEAVFVPAKPHGSSAFWLIHPGKIPDGTRGRFSSYLKSNDADEMKHFIEGTFTAKPSPTLKLGPNVEYIPGWKLADTVTGLESENENVNKAQLKYSREPGKYRLISIGGGFKGVVMSRSKDLDDPNNPIFQRFLHYKANRDGNVNPWGDCLIFDPVVREEGNLGTLSVGKLSPTLESAKTLARKHLSLFSLLNWQWPLAKQFQPGVKSELFKIGEIRNIVNMMNYRMWLMTKYTCKYFTMDGDSGYTKILVPKSGDMYIDHKVPPTPIPGWFQKLRDSNQPTFMPKTEGILTEFSTLFNIPPEELLPWLTAEGLTEEISFLDEKGKPLKWTEGKWFNEWGDKHYCEEIEVDEIAKAQALDPNDMKGIDLGMQLVEKVGSSMSFTRLASKLITTVEMRRNGPPGAALDWMAPSDMIGEIVEEFQTMIKDKREAKTDSTEVDDSKKNLRRRKREGGGSSQQRQTAQNLKGWKTQHRSPLKSNKTLSDNGLIFYGLGNCKQEAIPDLALHSSKDPNKIIDYFLKVMRIDCKASAKKDVMELINENWLVLDENKEFFEVSTTNPIVNEPRLTPEETKMLSLAFEFSAFTKTYHRLRTTTGNNTFPTSGFIEEPHTPITRSVGVLTDFALYVILKARKVSPYHAVRLTRNLLKTLRTVLTKLHQDALALEAECPNQCELDKRVTHGDKFRIISLMQFIIHGMTPFEQRETKPKSSFYEFVGLNKKAIGQRVEELTRLYAMYHLQ